MPLPHQLSMRNNKTKLLLAISFRQFNNFRNFIMAGLFILVAIWVLGYQDDFICLWHIFWCHIWYHLYSVKLCRVYLRIVRLWDCGVCDLFVHIDGDIIWCYAIDLTDFGVY